MGLICTAHLYDQGSPSHIQPDFDPHFNSDVLTVTFSIKMRDSVMWNECPPLNCLISILSCSKFKFVKRNVGLGSPAGCVQI